MISKSASLCFGPLTAEICQPEISRRQRRGHGPLRSRALQDDVRVGCLNVHPQAIQSRGAATANLAPMYEADFLIWGRANGNLPAVISAQCNPMRPTEAVAL